MLYLVFTAVAVDCCLKWRLALEPKRRAALRATLLPDIARSANMFAL